MGVVVTVRVSTPSTTAVVVPTVDALEDRALRTQVDGGGVPGLAYVLVLYDLPVRNMCQVLEICMNVSGPLFVGRGPLPLPVIEPSHFL